MNYYVAIPFFAVLVNVISTTYIFAQNRKDPVNEAYILLSVFFIGWMFFDILHWSPIDPDWIMPLLRIQSFFWLLAGFLFMHFTYVFLRKSKDIVYYITVSAAMSSVPVGLSSDMVIRGYIKEVWGTAIDPGPLYVPLVTLIVLFPFVYSLALFFLRSIRTDDVVERNQCRLIFYGTSGAVVLTFTTIIILPYFYNIPALPLTHFAIMLHLLFVFAAIVKYKFLAIGIRDAAQDIFSSVKDGVVLLSKVNDVVQINASARQILDIDSESDPQVPIDSLLGSDIGKHNIDEFETEYDVSNVTKTLRVSRSPLRQSGQDVGSILFVRDITSSKHAEYEVKRINADLAMARDEALAASKAKSQFLANMSHELRTPLNAIIGYSEMLKEEAGEISDKMLISDLGKINGAGHHLLGLINDILDLSKIEAGKMSLFPEEISVYSLVTEILETIKPLMASNSNTLVVNGLDSAGTIVTDATKLKQVLYNLLSNASKFTSGGEVKLEIDRIEGQSQRQIVFRVIDAGIGMNKEQVERLFEYFSQADPSTTRKYGGTGLGLAISQRFCELMGGKISATSTEGIGSIFEIQLPLNIENSRSASAERQGRFAGTAKSGGADERSAETEKSPAAGIRRVLVIDDDVAVRELLKRYLVREGYAVVEAAEGTQGISLAETEAPDIIILDVMMPGTNGWSVLEYLKSNPTLAAIPVIMLTMVDDRSRGYALGAINFFNKPLNWPELYKVIKETAGGVDTDDYSVLVVDDDRESRKTVRYSLEKKGWRVVEAENGKSALSTIKKQMPSLILLDLMMPEMNGFEFIDEIRRHEAFKSIPVFVLTAMDIDDDLRTNLNGQVQNIMIKGAYDQEELLQKIGDIITNMNRSM